MFRWLMMAALMVSAVSVSAQGKEAKDCCADKKPVVAQAQGDCCSDKPMTGEDAFMAEAKRMMALAEMKATGEKECCKSTPEKPMMKGDPGCCNAEGAPAKFKVYVAGQGYKFFGCADSAGEARAELMGNGHKVGEVQKVTKVRPI